MRVKVFADWALGAGLCLMVAACQTVQTPALPFPSSIDAEVQQLMAAEDVVGLAIAVIEDGEPAFSRAYGLRNVSEDLPLRTDTAMYAASFTKTAVAHLVLQQVDEGKIGLDTPLADYLPKPLPDYESFSDLAGDPRWADLTARHVLTHTTGLPNFRWFEDDNRLKFHRDPGDAYGYSGEGFLILQLALRDGLGVDLGQAMENSLFQPLDMSRTSMTWRPDFESNYAETYDEAGDLFPHEKWEQAGAPGSMDTTIEDQARLWAAILRGDRLSHEARQELTRDQHPIRSAHQFPTLRDWTDPRAAEAELSAGLGLVTFEGPQGSGFFKGGHDTGTGNIVVCLEDKARCVVFMSNSVLAERIYERLATFILGDTGLPWWWEYNFD